jgi:hypothetical protein
LVHFLAIVYPFSVERPDPARLSHDGSGLATTPAARGAMTEAISTKESDSPSF